MLNIQTILIKYFPDSQASEVIRINKGLQNLNYLVTMNGAKYVLRIYSSEHAVIGHRTKEHIQLELDFINHLIASHVPVPSPILDSDHEYMTEVDIDGQAQLVVMFTYVEGREMPAYTAEIAIEMAKVIGAIREASSTFHTKLHRPWPEGSMFDMAIKAYKRLDQARLKSPEVPIDALEVLLGDVKDGLKRVQKAQLPYGFIHGDIKLENALFDDGKLVAILDFDDMHKTYLVEEIVRTAMHDLDSPIRNLIRAGYWDQYITVLRRHVLENELNLVNDFIKARLLYDLVTYVTNGSGALVRELFADAELTKHL